MEVDYLLYHEDRNKIERMLEGLNDRAVQYNVTLPSRYEYPDLVAAVLIDKGWEVKVRYRNVEHTPDGTWTYIKCDFPEGTEYALPDGWQKDSSVQELLDILHAYTRGLGEGTQRREGAMARLRAMSEEDKEVVGFTFVNDIVEELEGFLEPDENDENDVEGGVKKRSLMQTIDTNVVVMNGKHASKPCTAYMSALDFHVHKKDVHITGSLVFALNPWDGLTNALKTDHKKKACDALKRLLETNRDEIKAWTNALKGGFVMPKLRGNRRAFPIVSEKAEAIWELIEDFEELWKR